MIFNSSIFLIFFPIVFIFYWLLRRQEVVYQNIFILIASYVFYGWWDWRFLSLIGFSTIVDYFVGQKLAEADSPKQKKLFLGISIVTNLGLLGFFKYYNFFISSLQDSLQLLGLDFEIWTLNIILPVGISFYTFQTLSYSIDIYKGKIQPTKDFISFAAFVSFFPQLVAGPIERASNLLPQFLSPRKFDSENAINGLSLIAYGLFKKLVIADRLALYVNSVFGDIENQSTISLIIGIVFFSFQIYCDFSGYSLIARGAAKLLGFELMINFRKPYLAASIPDFWRRWHISLSTWFRDYVYIPLGGNRVSTSRNYLNLMIVFLVSGLWHGANWTFIIWGGLHGIFQIIYLTYQKIFKPSTTQSLIRKIVNVLFINTIVGFAWIFFRAQNVKEAFLYISKIAELDFSLNLVQLTAGEGPFNLMLSFLAIGLLYLSYLLPSQLTFTKNRAYILFNSITILLIIILGVNGKTEFIYFQF